MSIALAPNPLRKGLTTERATDPCVFVIFGGSGNLSRRKLLPALYRLYLADLLPRNFAIVMYASPDWRDDQCCQEVRQWIAKTMPRNPPEGRLWDNFARFIHAVRRTGNMRESLANLKRRVEETDTRIRAEGNYLFYLAIPPSIFVPTTKELGLLALASAGPSRDTWRRLVVEKPFGMDLESSRNLNSELLSVFSEENIFRIDHYLGKETVQNILVFRFANEFVEPVLNAEHVDHIQITVAETVGLEGRVGYYEGVGALRDMVANHMLQVMALVCMERPESHDVEAIRDAKVRFFRSVRPIEPSQVNEVSVRARYTSGQMIGHDTRGYLEEDGVGQDSMTETYVALKLHIDNSRWRGVPVYLRHGKRLAKRVSEVGIQLKNGPRIILGASDDQRVEPNVISIKIQPDEGVGMRFEAKVPGFRNRVQPVRMDFRYGSEFGRTPPEAYERLILDVLRADRTLFPRADGVDAAWAIVDPVLSGWKRYDSPIYDYSPGSWGPGAANALLTHDGRKWRRL